MVAVAVTSVLGSRNDARFIERLSHKLRKRERGGRDGGEEEQWALEAGPSVKSTWGG